MEPGELIHNELLCFIGTKMDVMPYDMLVKLRVDFYNPQSIEAAKDLLFETAFYGDREVPRKINRKGQNKNNRTYRIL